MQPHLEAFPLKALIRALAVTILTAGLLLPTPAVVHAGGRPPMVEVIIQGRDMSTAENAAHGHGVR